MLGRNSRCERVSDRVSEALAETPEHVRMLVVFGSYARGYPHEDSDLDIYVVTDAVDERYLGDDPGVAGLDLPDDLPEPHVVAVPPAEFVRRYYADDEFLETVLEEGWYLEGVPRDITDAVDHDPIAA